MATPLIGNKGVKGVSGVSKIRRKFGLSIKRKRNYRKEYDTYHGTTIQKKNRAKRNSARRRLGLKKGDPREADHKRPLSKGGSNSRRNLRAISRTSNRKKFIKTD